MKPKNFKDDPAFKEKDNERRLVLPSSKLSKDAAEALEKHFRETRSGVQAWHSTVCNLHIVTFIDAASSLAALQVMEEDRGLVEKPEQLMSLTQYTDAWQRALDRQKEREEMLEADDVEESGDVSEDQFEEKDVEMEVGEETSDQMEEETNVQNSQNGFDASEKFFALCKGFTDEDCDVEEYFEENHENVEQVWQRGKGEGCEVYVRFKDETALQRFLTLNYVRYRARPITVSLVKPVGDLAEYLLG